MRGMMCGKLYNTAYQALMWVMCIWNIIDGDRGDVLLAWVCDECQHVNKHTHLSQTS